MDLCSHYDFFAFLKINNVWYINLWSLKFWFNIIYVLHGINLISRWFINFLKKLLKFSKLFFEQFGAVLLAKNLSCGDIVKLTVYWWTFWRKRMNVSLEKDLIFRFHIKFSASFAFYFLVSYTQSRTSEMVYFNIETLNSGVNLSL